MLQFDASITIGPLHLASAGLDPRARLDDVVDAVTNAVRQLPGAAWIDVAVEDFQSRSRPWVEVYPVGFARVPNTPEWRTLRETMEATIRAALASVAARV